MREFDFRAMRRSEQLAPLVVEHVVTLLDAKGLPSAGVGDSVTLSGVANTAITVKFAGATAGTISLTGIVPSAISTTDFHFAP